MRERVGVNNTGLAFNSVVAIELNDGHPMNPMVNAGASATTALIPGQGPKERWEAIREGLSRFAGRALELDEEVYRSEAATNQRNRGDRAVAGQLWAYRGGSARRGRRVHEAVRVAGERAQTSR